MKSDRDSAIASFVGGYLALLCVSVLLVIVGSRFEFTALPHYDLISKSLVQLGSLGLVLGALSSPLLFLSPSRRRAVLQVRTYIAIIAVTAVVTFAVGELYLRVVYSDGMSFSNHNGPLVRRFERDFTFNRFDGPSRGPEIRGAKQPDDIRVLVQGDSITWGQGVKAESSLYTHRLLERLRADNPQIDMAVVARAGREIDKHLAQLRKWGAGIDPDIIIYQWYINDLELDKSHREYRDHIWRHLFFHPVLERFSYLWYLLDYRFDVLLSGGERSYGDYIGRYFAPGTIGWQHFAETFHAWATEAKQLTPAALVALYPDIDAWSDPNVLAIERAVRTLAEQDGLSVIELSPSLDEFRDDPRQMYASPFDAHPNATAHERLAAALYTRLWELWPEVLSPRQPDRQIVRPGNV